MKIAVVGASSFQELAVAEKTIKQMLDRNRAVVVVTTASNDVAELAETMALRRKHLVEQMQVIPDPVGYKLIRTRVVPWDKGEIHGIGTIKTIRPYPETYESVEEAEVVRDREIGRMAERAIIFLDATSRIEDAIVQNFRRRHKTIFVYRTGEGWFAP